jgi:hypothetical protein
VLPFFLITCTNLSKGSFDQGSCRVEDLSTIRCENTSQCGGGEKGRHGNDGERYQHPHRGRSFSRESRPSASASSRCPRIPICLCQGSATRHWYREVVATLGLRLDLPSNPRVAPIATTYCEAYGSRFSQTRKSPWHKVSETYSKRLFLFASAINNHELCKR